MEDSNQNPSQEKESFIVRNVWLSPLFFVYFVSVLIALGMLYVNRENMVNRNSIKPDLAIDSTFFNPIASTPPAPPSSTIGPKVTITSLLTPTGAQIASGKKLFVTDCAPCHGLDGRGDGPAAATLNPKPRDYYAAKGWVNGKLLSEMFKTVSEGITGTAMVSFASALSASQRLDVVDYVRASFGTFPKDTPAQLEQMVKTYHLKAPTSTSASVAPAAPIPVSEAMKEIEASVAPASNTVESLSAYIEQDTTDPGAEIFKSVVLDNRRAVTALAASNIWSKNLSDFVTVLTSDAVQNGFDPKVTQLSAQDWQTLYNYLKGVFNKRVKES